MGSNALLSYFTVQVSLGNFSFVLFVQVMEFSNNSVKNELIVMKFNWISPY